MRERGGCEAVWYEGFIYIRVPHAYVSARRRVVVGARGGAASFRPRSATPALGEYRSLNQDSSRARERERGVVCGGLPKSATREPPPRHDHPLSDGFKLTRDSPQAITKPQHTALDLLPRRCEASRKEAETPVERTRDVLLWQKQKQQQRCLARCRNMIYAHDDDLPQSWPPQRILTHRGTFFNPYRVMHAHNTSI